MRKAKIGSILLLLISVIIFVGFKITIKMVQDTTPPVLSCASEVLEVSVSVTEEELLADVSAQDDKSGDVSDQLVIESMSEIAEDGTCTITYAAVDEKMNVGRVRRTLRYTDYQKPTFDLSQPLIFPVGSRINVFDSISAHSVMDGSLDEKIKYALKTDLITTEVGEYPIEFRVKDSAGSQVYLTISIEIYDSKYSDLELQLSDYLVYLEKGSAFQPTAYFKGAQTAHGADGNTLSVTADDLQIQSNVDTQTEGTYYADYILNYNGLQGKTRLIVVVE